MKLLRDFEIEFDQFSEMSLSPQLLHLRAACISLLTAAYFRRLLWLRGNKRQCKGPGAKKCRLNKRQLQASCSGCWSSLEQGFATKTQEHPWNLSSRSRRSLDVLRS